MTMDSTGWEPPQDAAIEGFLSPGDGAAGGVKNVRLVVVTGAGISAESRIPTYRGGGDGNADDREEDMSALWASFDPMTLATPEAFARDPELVTRWYDHRRRRCLEAEPNAGHCALADLESLITAAGGSMLIVTQNVDGLHQRAGSDSVVEIHGSILRWRCTSTGRTLMPDPKPFESAPMPSPYRDEEHDSGDSPAWIRPDVVWFGEALPDAAVDATTRALRVCTHFMSIGTSSVVWPVAGFVDDARAAGARTLEINPDATERSSDFDAVLRGPGGAAIPWLLERWKSGHGRHGAGD